ncbi:MAG: hypothetical protein QF368_00235 [SAR202 cluster bacterium]|nr:hypothetical protein [SAR202 cluster bacterium]
MTTTIVNATYKITVHDLEFMALDQRHLPQAYSEYRTTREGPLNNREMAETGFPGSTEERFHEAGRIAGHMREFGPPKPSMSDDGIDFVVASVAHLFNNPDSVSDWMSDVFLHDFQRYVGRDVGHGQKLVDVQQLEPSGFFDEAVALKAVHSSRNGLVSSTVIDFRVGRILGVAYVGAVGDYNRIAEATELGLALEQNLVSVVLGI